MAVTDYRPRLLQNRNKFPQVCNVRAIVQRQVVLAGKPPGPFFAGVNKTFVLVMLQFLSL